MITIASSSHHFIGSFIQYSQTSQKKIKKKETKLSFLMDDMIVYIENPKTHKSV